MSGFKKGAAALGALNAEQGGGNDLEITKFKSGTTLKVRVKGTEDVMQYFGYGVFGKVHTFIPKNPAERNDKGFVTANPTPWDKASQYLYNEAKKAEEAGKSEADVKKIKDQAYLYKGDERYLMGFGSLENGEDIIVDLSKKQAKAVYATIVKYEKKLDKLAFELSKTGQKTDTVVALSPIIDMDEDLTDVERANFQKCGEVPFNHAKFDGILFEADEKTQIENLVAAGFDIALIGLSIGAKSETDEATPIGSVDISDEDLPF